MLNRNWILLILLNLCVLSCGENKDIEEQVGLLFSTDDIVYNSEKSGSYQIYSKNLVTGVEVQLTSDTDFDYWWPRISPDRTKVLFYKAPVASNQDFGDAELFTASPDGSGQTSIINLSEKSWTLQAHAEWSPNGDKLLMCAAVGGTLHILTTDILGNNESQLTTDGTWNCDPSWSPSGDKVLFNRCTTVSCGGTSRPDLELYVLTVSDLSMTRLTTNSKADYDPYFSPDGATIAWLRLEDSTAFGGVGSWSINKMNSDGSLQTAIINDGFVNSKPGWTIDGSKIHFHRIDGSTNGKWQVFEIAPDGSGLEKLDIDAGFNVEYPTSF